MMRRIVSAMATVTLVTALAGSTTSACRWAMGYFVQVSQLKGTIVGSSFPILHSFRWFRQSFTRPNTKLTLYKYCWPCDTRKLPPVKQATTDKNGGFDFGSLEPDHYILGIADEKDDLYDWYDVEVKGLPNPKQFVTIDISPNYPDCTGGHEFIVRSK